MRHPEIKLELRQGRDYEILYTSFDCLGKVESATEYHLRVAKKQILNELHKMENRGQTFVPPLSAEQSVDASEGVCFVVEEMELDTPWASKRMMVYLYVMKHKCS